ncbi:MAG: GatB/YqeY domain-containing protein, partial [Candidatus Paceibacteria bacterium]
MSNSIEEQVKADLKQALKEKRNEERDVLRIVSSELKNAQIENSDFSEEDAIQVLTKLAKQRKQAAQEYRDANRDDLAKKEEAEAQIISRYLPEEMSEEEIEQHVEAVISELGEEAALGDVMKQVMPRVKGKADGSQVQQKVREKLG